MTPLPGRRAARAPAFDYLNRGKRHDARAASGCYIEFLVRRALGLRPSHANSARTQARFTVSGNALMRAEIIAIGSELTSGQSLDTNSQWLSQQLSALGITVAFHTTLGDVLEDHLTAFRIAMRPGRPGRDDRRPGPDAGRPDARSTRRRGRRAAGRRCRFAGGDRRHVRPPQSRDERAQPRPGPLSPGGRAAAEPGRNRARDLDADRPRDGRLPARRASRDETDVPGTGRAPACARTAGSAGSPFIARSTCSARGNRRSKPRRWT